MKTEYALDQLVAAPELAIDPYRTYKAWEVAILVFRHSPEWFRKHKMALLKAGFPRPISNTFNAPWHGEDLLAWLRRDKSIAPNLAEGVNVTDLTARLTARAKAVARRA